MLVPRERLAEAEQLAAAVAGQLKVADPFEPDANLGPLVSETQRERVRGYIRKGVEEGAKLVTGGRGPARRAATAATSCSRRSSPRSRPR